MNIYLIGIGFILGIVTQALSEYLSRKIFSYISKGLLVIVKKNEDNEDNEDKNIKAICECSS